MLVFLLKTHLDPLGFIYLGGSTKFQTYMKFIASNHFLE